MKKDIDYTKISSKASDYLNPKGKLTELGIMLVVDALLIKREDLLPVEVLEHLQKNPDIQEDIYEYYQAMRQLNTGYLHTHPYFKPSTRQRLKHRKQLRMKSAVLVLTMLVGVWLLIYFVKRIDNFQFKPDSQAEITPIEPLSKIPDIQVGYISYDQDKEKLIVPLNQAKKFVLDNGSEIIIPEGAFVNQAGEKIYNDIEIKYREFHKAAEIIASGIPMNYDSAGVNYHFESAGMFEIRAFQKNGQEAFLANNKSIQVNMAAVNDEDDFNHYYLEEQADQKPKWQLLGRSVLSNEYSKKEVFAGDAVQVREEITLTEDGRDNIRRSIQINGKTLPFEIDTPLNPIFQLKLNLDKSPNLEPFEKSYWQWQDMGNLSENPYVNTWVLDTKWEEVELNPLSNVRYDSLNLDLSNQIEQLYFSQDERYLLLSSRGEKAQIIDLETGRSQYFENSWTAKFSPDEQHVLTTLDDVRLWTLDGELVHNYGTPEYGVKFTKFSPDGKLLMISSNEHHIRLYDTQGNFITRIWAGSQDYNYALSTFEINNFHSEDAYFTPDSKYIVVKSMQGDYQSWDMKGNPVKLNYDYPFPNTERSTEEILNDPSLLDSYIKQSTQLKRIYLHLRSLWNEKVNTLLLDFEVEKSRSKLFTNNRLLIDVLTKLSKGYSKHATFSSKGTYLVVKTQNKMTREAGEETAVYFNTNDITLWKRKPELEKAKQRYEMILKRDGFGRKGNFRMIVTKSSAQNAKEEKTIAQAIENYKKQIKEAKKSAQKQAENTDKLYRVFEVKKLGIYNVDRIYKMQDQIAVQADFQWDKPQTQYKTPITVYLICGDNQSVVIPFHQNNWNKFSFNPKDQNQLIAILPDSKVAYFKPKDFAKINLNKINKQDKYTFKLHTKATTGSLDELKAILN